jgi:uncharacterized membrane protein
MIGRPELLILLVLFFLVAGPVVVGVVIWKYVIKPSKDPFWQIGSAQKLVFVCGGPFTRSDAAQPLQ